MHFKQSHGTVSNLTNLRKEEVTDIFLFLNYFASFLIQPLSESLW